MVGNKIQMYKYVYLYIRVHLILNIVKRYNCKILGRWWGFVLLIGWCCWGMFQMLL